MSHLNNIQSFVAAILFALLALAGCTGDIQGSDPWTPPEQEKDEISPERQIELEDLALEWVETRDDSLIEEVRSEAELNFVVPLLRHWQQEIEGIEIHPPVSNIAGCSGYWGVRADLSHRVNFAENRWANSSYSHYWSPNCAMPAGDLDGDGDGDCGEDYDDNMVSFWMGTDYTLIEPYYRVDSDSWPTYWVLWYHGGASYRVYRGTFDHNPTVYGNAYVCLSNLVDASTLRFGRAYWTY